MEYPIRGQPNLYHRQGGNPGRYQRRDVVHPPWRAYERFGTGNDDLGCDERESNLKR